MRRLLSTLSALAGLATWLPAQSRVALTKPEATFADPFTSVRGIRELPDGRVVVSDLQDKVVQLVDFRAAIATKIGREGQGPEEYAMPAGLYALPDGGALLQDFGNRRFLSIGPDGKVGRAISPPQPAIPAGAGPARGGPPMMMGALLDPRGVDQPGRIYFQGMALPGGEGGTVDSVPIMRWDRARTIDTVAWLPVSPDMRPQVIRSGNTMQVRIGSQRAWPAQVQWGVAGDGRIALVQPDPYRVTWLAPAGRTAGPVVPYAPIKVTDADRKDYQERMARARPMMVAFGGPAGARPATPPPSIRATQDEPEWPDTKPPFTGRDAVLVTPAGEVWVERTRRADDPAPVYDIFDRAGRLTGRATLRPRSRIVGFGRGAVYVVRTDEDDLEYLERYRRQ